jgi:hypothetical protein
VADEMLIAPNDVLVVKAWNAIVAQSLSIKVRYRTPDCQIVNSVFTMTPSADRLENTLKIPLPARAFLIGVSVHTSVSTQRGQTFVRLAIAQDGTPPTEYLILAQDYVTVGAPLGWPGGRISSPTEGSGAVRTFVGTRPPAASVWSETVPTNARWVIRSILSRLSTDAADFGRFVLLFVDVPEGHLLSVDAQSNQGALVTNDYIYAPGLQVRSVDGFRKEHHFPIDYPLRAGSSFSVIVFNMRDGDQFESPIFHVEEWIDV